AAEVHDRHAVLAQRRAERRAGLGPRAFELDFHDCFDSFRHYLPPPSLAASGSNGSTCSKSSSTCVSRPNTDTMIFTLRRSISISRTLPIASVNGPLTTLMVSPTS